MVSATVRDLADLARERGESVPPLAVAMIFVQTLEAIGARQSHKLVLRTLTLDEITLGVDSPAILLADPSRDPKVGLNVVARTAPSNGAAGNDLRAVAALARELLGDERPTALAGLLDRILDRRRGAPSTASAAYIEARQIALELFEKAERCRRGPRLEERLRQALDGRHESQVKELATELRELAPSSLMLDVAESWLRRRESDRDAVTTTRRQLSAALYRRRRHDVERLSDRLASLLGDRAGEDADLAVARGWLAECRRRQRRRRAKVRRSSLALVVTGAPVVLATLLSGLLLVVMVWTG